MEQESKMIISGTILPKRAVKQVIPKVYQYGDCGACVLAGLIGWTDVSLVYERLQENGKIEPFSHPTMRSALWRAKSLGLICKLVDNFPIWPIYKSHMTWGNVSWKQNLEWFDYISMAIDGGYYGIASININGDGPCVDTDHMVLICGTRERSEPNQYVEGAKIIIQEILVSCSAHHPEGQWYEVIDFLKNRGGFNCYLAKPN